jgi:predicted NBD/HSP70 family sugar kinase
MNVLAADIGGASLRAALVGEGGAIAERRARAAPRDPADGVTQLRAYWDALGPAAGRALVVAGGIRDSDGEITQSPNLPRWEGTHPGRYLDCTVLNDTNGALLGEAWLGALRGKRSALMLTLGTGVGGAVLLDGALWTGATGCAGEIGHVPALEGHLEMYATTSRCTPARARSRRRRALRTPGSRPTPLGGGTRGLPTHSSGRPRRSAWFWPASSTSSTRKRSASAAACRQRGT